MIRTVSLSAPGAGERKGIMAPVLVADKGRAVTSVFDVEERSQFETLYSANGLHNIEEKITYLKKAMKIKASASNKKTPEEELAGLEDSILLGLWEGYNDEDFLKLENGDISLDDAIAHNGGHLDLVNTSILLESCV